MRFVLPLLLSLSFVSPVGHALVPDPHYCENQSDRDCSYWLAENFRPWDALDARARELLATTAFGALRSEELAGEWEQWTRLNDAEAATFLALMRAFSLMDIAVDDDRGSPAWVNSRELIESVTAFIGTRLFVRMDADLFERWRQSGGSYRIRRADGKIESGRFRFNRGDLGGSLHKGFDIQGYTSVRKEPRIQINYRFSDSEADIDLDLAGWIWGFIPNPRHLKYEGSDVRQWIGKYVKKFGDPGFTVRRWRAGN